MVSRGFNVEYIRNNYQVGVLEILPGGGDDGEAGRFLKGFGLLGLMRV